MVYLHLRYPLEQGGYILVQNELNQERGYGLWHENLPFGNLLKN